MYGHYTMAKPQKQTRKGKLVGVRFASTEFEQIKKRAQSKGMKTAEYLRDLSRRDLEKAGVPAT